MPLLMKDTRLWFSFISSLYDKSITVLIKEMFHLPLFSEKV